MAELRNRKIEAEVVTIPFRSFPAKDLHACIDMALNTDLRESCGKKIDRLIGLKFPTYFAPHPNKVMWILHQHREVYDLWNHPALAGFRTEPGIQELKTRIEDLDKALIPRSTGIYTISRKVTDRLRSFSGLSSNVLYPPPADAEFFLKGPFSDYIYFPSRIGILKRQELAIKALALTRSEAKLIFAGAPDDPGYLASLQELAKTLGVADRIQWKGYISQNEKISLYSQCKAVLFTPVDEDLGYISMEAMLSSKPVITCTDSGGPLEFVQHDVNGLIADPTPESVALAIDSAWTAGDAKLRRWGDRSLDLYHSKNISWDEVIERLIDTT